MFATKALLSAPCYNLTQGLQTCFNLLKTIIERVTEETENDGAERVFDNIKNLILGRKDLLTIFLINVLEDQPFDLNFKNYYSILDECKD